MRYEPFPHYFIWRAQKMPQGWHSHYVALTLEWRDQGYGRVEGRLFWRMKGMWTRE